MRSSQKWNCICILLSSMNLFMIFPLVWNISIKDKRSSINRCLKSTLSRSHCWAVFWSILNAHGLDLFSGNRFCWCVLSEKFRVCHCWVIECNVIVHWTVEEFSISGVSDIVILGALDVEIWDPTKLTINVSIFWNVWIIWHSSSFNLIHFIWIIFSSWLKEDWLFRLELLIEILSVVGVVFTVENRWTMLESFVPLVVSRG